MILNYKNTGLEIYVDNKLLDYDINKDIDIDLVRNYFNESISKLSQGHNTIEYWLMRISERNTLVHNLFLDICRIELIKSLHKNNNKLVIYTKNIAIYTYFKNNSTIKIKDSLTFESRKLFEKYKPYLQLIKFISKETIFNIKLKKRFYAKRLSSLTIIQTWVSDTNFKDNKFKDSYYGNLADYLKKNEKQVITWPIFYNVKNEKKAVNFLRKNSEDFLFIEDYLRVSDYLYAIKLFFKKRFFKFGKIEINRNDYTSIFKYYQNKETIGKASLFYNFTKRLKEKGSENITFIHHHENMIPEKALILGVRKYLKNSKVIGYFHTSKPKNQLCLDYASDKEYKIAPKPDAIIFNSDKYKKYYEDKYSNIPMFSGMAFKQEHLQNSNNVLDKLSDEILVLFSGINNEIELMFSLLNQISNDYNFIFRMHPMNQFIVKEYYSKDNYKVVNNQSLDDSLSKVNKIISTYSAVALESALKGFIVGLVYNKTELLLNPFDYTDIENYKLISNVTELNEFLKEELTMKEVEQIFNIDEEFYKIFLEIT